MSRPLDDLEADIRETTSVIWQSMLLYAAVTIGIMAVLLRQQVTGPLARLAAATSALGRDLSARLDLPPGGEDEIGMLSAGLLEMQSELNAARQARADEQVEREALERRLREADKLIVLGQLAAGVAHEIGSPLQVMVGRAQMLADDPKQTDDVGRQARLIVEQCTRIAGIVSRMQDLGRRRPTRVMATDLADEASKVTWLLESEARRRGVALVWDRPLAPVMVWADPDELQQVVLNLTLNALQAVPRSGVVRVKVQARDGHGLLVVQDDGPGIHEGTLSRLFDPFYTTRESEGGTGLGLAIVKSIADRHGAKVAVHSLRGAGARFEVSWPMEGT